MTVEAAIFAVVGPLVGGRLYPDPAPAGTQRPYGTFEQIGGQSNAFLEGGAAPSRKHARFQFNLWHDSRKEAIALAYAVDDAMRNATTFQAEPIGEMEWQRDEAQKLLGTRQDFSVWSAR